MDSNNDDVEPNELGEKSRRSQTWSHSKPPEEAMRIQLKKESLANEINSSVINNENDPQKITEITTNRPSSQQGKKKSSNIKKIRKHAWGSNSYAEIIQKAIETSPEKRLTLAQIYDYMIKNFQYFAERSAPPACNGWKNSVRHNLSLHEKFARIVTPSPNKMSYWTFLSETNLSKNKSGGSIQRNINNAKRQRRLQASPDFYNSNSDVSDDKTRKPAVLQANDLEGDNFFQRVDPLPQESFIEAMNSTGAFLDINMIQNNLNQEKRFNNVGAVIGEINDDFFLKDPLTSQYQPIIVDKNLKDRNCCEKLNSRNQLGINRNVKQQFTQNNVNILLNNYENPTIIPPRDAPHNLRIPMEERTHCGNFSNQQHNMQNDHLMNQLQLLTALGNENLDFSAPEFSGSDNFKQTIKFNIGELNRNSMIAENIISNFDQINKITYPSGTGEFLNNFTNVNMNNIVNDNSMVQNNFIDGLTHPLNKQPPTTFKDLHLGGIQINPDVPSQFNQVEQMTNFNDWSHTNDIHQSQLKLYNVANESNQMNYFNDVVGDAMLQQALLMGNNEQLHSNIPISHQMIMGQNRTGFNNEQMVNMFNNQSLVHNYQKNYITNNNGNNEMNPLTNDQFNELYRAETNNLTLQSTNPAANMQQFQILNDGFNPHNHNVNINHTQNHNNQRMERVNSNHNFMNPDVYVNNTQGTQFESKTDHKVQFLNEGIPNNFKQIP